MFYIVEFSEISLVETLGSGLEEMDREGLNISILLPN